MNKQTRWEYSVHYSGEHFEIFFKNWLSKSRDVLVICGLGWDPRMTACISAIKDFGGSGLRKIDLISQNPKTEQNEKKKRFIEKNLFKINQIESGWCQRTNVSVTKQGDDGIYIGGDEIIKHYREVETSQFTDIIIDVSALPKKLYFPLIKTLMMKADKNSQRPNIFVVTCQYPSLDGQKVKNDGVPGLITSFEGNLSNGALVNSFLIWVPILGIGYKTDMELLYLTIRPHDVYPVLPLSSRIPRLDDNLIKEHADLFDQWNLNPQNIIYATEDDPLDIYRSLCRLYQRQKVALEPLEGINIILSALSSKISSLGAFMAAYEFGFPVAHGLARHQPPDTVEECDWDDEKMNEFRNNLHAICLVGEPYLE